MQKLPELSIFFPFWNEQENVETVVKKAIPIAEKVAKKWEIIIVDDGSEDDTFSIAKELSKKEKNISVVSHHPNRGYGAALKEGFVNAKYDYIVFTDGDDQFDFSEITRLIEKIDESDIVIGYRKRRRDGNLIKRLLLMYLLKVWDYILFGFYFKDIDCAFKLFTKKAVTTISPLRSEGALISTEILAKAKKHDLRITEVGVNHYPRKYGHQTGANPAVILRAIFESFILWWDLKNGRA